MSALNDDRKNGFMKRRVEADEAETRRQERRLREALIESRSVTAESETDSDRALAPVDEAPFPLAMRDSWPFLPVLHADPDTLDRHLVITARRRDPAHAAFDVLRGRMMQALNDHHWYRVGITSPTRGCGKSFTAINLAISLSRFEGWRTVLLEMDLRHSSLASMLGVQSPANAADFLRGSIAPAAYLRKLATGENGIGDSLAIGLNGRSEAFPAELFQRPESAEALARIQAEMRPNVVLYDLPPALAQDDVLSMRQHLDCMLVVVGGGTTNATELREMVRRLGDDLPILGVVLNNGEPVHPYGYS